MTYHLTRQALRLDLYVAFLCAKRHKGSKPYVRHFERDLDANLDRLCDELWQRTYRPEPSTCFIVRRPKKREVFAAQFRDRIVHHLYYNYTHQLFEATFIRDSYSCIEGRGTLDGIERLARHIRQESHGYQRRCYVMKLDKRGYFMHIHRPTLLRIALRQLRRMASHRVPANCAVAGGSQGVWPSGNPLRWRDVIDIDFVCRLTREIVLLDPREHCRVAGPVEAWDDLDHAKSLFYTLDGCGLPIGNLTSQLFSNVYLNEFDQYVKRTLRCRHYGRYVDDSFIVSTDRLRLVSLIPQIRRFLKTRLHLGLHMGKLHIFRADYGVEFLGAYAKPSRRYASTQTLRRIEAKVRLMEALLATCPVSQATAVSVARQVNSILGILSHTASFNIRCRLFFTFSFLSIGTFDRDMTKFVITNHSLLKNNQQ